MSEVERIKEISGEKEDEGILRAGDYSSGDESEDADNSSHDSDSVADFIPLLDDLHPLLDSEAPQPANISSDESVDDDEEEIENQEEEEEEEEEEAREAKDDTSEAVVSWTADDQKNLMDLGSSELERNQRLENLIAKRMARKFLSFHASKNLIDLDDVVDDPVVNTDDLSRFQVAPISAPRRNPFDLPFDAEENSGLPPIPGSAPSVLQPRRNPFDLPLDQIEASENIRREITHIQEMSYPREESSHPILKPYFVPERMDTEETGVPVLERELTEKSDSDSSSSSSTDQEDHEELLEDLDHEIVAPLDQDSESSEELDDDDDDDDVVAEEMEIRQGEPKSPESHAGSLAVIEDIYDDSVVSVPADSDMSSHHVDPVYDSSPTTLEKSSSPNFDESLVYAGKESTSELESAAQEKRS